MNGWQTRAKMSSIVAIMNWITLLSMVVTMMFWGTILTKHDMISLPTYMISLPVLVYYTLYYCCFSILFNESSNVFILLNVCFVVLVGRGYY